MGHLASVVSEIKTPGPAAVAVVVRLDGTKEPAFEDCGLYWPKVSELDAGYLNHHDRSTPSERRGWFGRTVRYLQQGGPRRFDFAWLPADEAADKWVELGLTDGDF